MMTTITTEIHHIKHNFEISNSIEVNLEKILEREYTQELPNDLNNVI